MAAQTSRAAPTATHQKRSRPRDRACKRLHSCTKPRGTKPQCHSRVHRNRNRRAAFKVGKSLINKDDVAAPAAPVEIRVNDKAKAFNLTATD